MVAIGIINWVGEIVILNGWKEIANHLGRGVRTVQRWEQLGLPVRRPKGTDRSAVLALSEELDEWVKRCATHASFQPPQFTAGLNQLTASLNRTVDLITQVRAERQQLSERTQELRAQIQRARARHSLATQRRIAAAFAAAAPSGSRVMISGSSR